MDLPLPQNWQEFEKIVRDAQAARWNSPTLQLNGRPGQAQAGVDIYGPDYLGRATGIQCKRYEGPLKFDVIQTEIGNAEKFKGQLTTLYIATTADYDAPLQERVRILSEDRAKKGLFAVGVLFWDDIVAGLVRDPAAFSAHYPNFTLSSNRVADKERLLAGVELGYYGGELWEYIELIYGEYGWMASADPDELIATLRVLEHRVQQLLEVNDANPILQSIAGIRTGLTTPKKSRSDWDQIQTLAKRVSQRISRASSLLGLEESNALDTGLHLVRIYHHVDDLPDEGIRKAVRDKVDAILPAASRPTIEEVFSKADTLSSGYRWAMRVFGLVTREIRYR